MFLANGKNKCWRCGLDTYNTIIKDTVFECDKCKEELKTHSHKSLIKQLEGNLDTSLSEAHNKFKECCIAAGVSLNQGSLLVDKLMKAHLI